MFRADIVGGAPGSIFDTAYVSSILENGVAFLKFQKEAGDEKYFEQFDRTFTACIDEKYGYEFKAFMGSTPREYRCSARKKDNIRSFSVGEEKKEIDKK